MTPTTPLSFPESIAPPGVIVGVMDRWRCRGQGISTLTQTGGLFPSDLYPALDVVGGRVQGLFRSKCESC